MGLTWGRKARLPLRPLGRRIWSDAERGKGNWFTLEQDLGIGRQKGWASVFPIAAAKSQSPKPRPWKGLVWVVTQALARPFRNSVPFAFWLPFQFPLLTRSPSPLGCT